MPRTRQQIAIQLSIFVLEYWVTFGKPCPYNALSRQFHKAFRAIGIEPYAMPGLTEIQAYVHSWLTPRGSRYFIPLSVWKTLDEVERAKLLCVEPKRQFDYELLRKVQAKNAERPLSLVPNEPTETSMRALKEKLDKSA